MQRKYIFVILLTSLLLIFGKAYSWEIKELKVNKTTLKEAELFEVEAIIEGEANKLTFTWDWGDGSEKLQLSEPKAYHVFYISDGSRSKNFRITLVVSDGKKLDTETLDITVKKAYGKIRPFLQQVTKLNEKNKPFKVMFEILDSSDNIISSSYVESLQANLNGASMEIKAESEDLYSVEIIPRCDFDYVEFLHINAEVLLGAAHNIKRTLEVRVPIYFAPVNLSILKNPVEDKKLYAGDSLGEVQLQIACPDGTIVKAGDFYASLISDSNIIETQQLNYVDLYFRATFAYKFSLEDVEKKYEMMFEGTDNHGNILPKTTFPVLIGKDNPAFDLVLIEPSAKEKEFGYGQKVSFIAKINSNLRVEEAEVYLVVPSLNMKRYFSKEGDKFVLELAMPEKKVYKTEFKIVAIGRADGKELADYEKFKGSITNNISVEFLYPYDAKKGRTLFEEENALKVYLKYPDGSLVQFPKVRAVLYLDGEKKDVVLKRDEVKGYYFYKFDEPLLGAHKLKIDLRDKLQGTKEAEVVIVKQTSWHFTVGLLFILVLVGIIGYVIYSRFKHWKDLQMSYIKRISQIDREIKRLELSVFKRKITPEQYKEKVLLLQNEKDTLKEKIVENTNFVAFIREFLKAVLPKKRSALKPIVVGKLPKLPEKEPEQPIREAETEAKQAEEELKQMVREAKPEERKKVSVAREKVPEKQEVKTEVVKKKPKTEELEEIKKEIEKKETSAKEKPTMFESYEQEFSSEERAEIERLCSILAPIKNKYSVGELYKALIAEGYKPSIALAVITKLFKKS